MRVLRRLSSLGRLALALALLGGLWAATLRGIESTSDQADNRRLADRVDVARGFAGAIRPWFDAARPEADKLARDVAAVRTAAAGRPILESHFASRPAFAREVVLVDRNRRFVAGSRGPAMFDSRQVAECPRPIDDGVAFADLVSQPALGLQRVAAPWDCTQDVPAVAAPSGPNVVVVFGSFADIAPLLAAARVDSQRIELVGPSFVPADPSDISGRQRFVAAARGGEESTGRYAALVAAYADVGAGWGVLLEQEQAEFDLDLRNSPALVGTTVLTCVFVALFLLLAFFDLRRRRAHERSEVAKHAFFATVGHELRTPLTVLKGYSETLSSRWDTLDDSRRKMLIENMVPQTRRLGNIVEKLLFASNIQAEAYLKPKAADVDVVARLHKVASDFAPLAPLHRFDVDVAVDLPDARADIQALDMVLRELVDNAVKYSPSGGIVRLTAKKTRRGVEISITDEGVGLPANERRIFEPLVQGESVDTRVHDEGGAGVGLYIVRTLVRDMGGSVRAERLKPSGSRFVVTLRPVRASRPAAAIPG